MHHYFFTPFLGSIVVLLLSFLFEAPLWCWRPKNDWIEIASVPQFCFESVLGFVKNEIKLFFLRNNGFVLTDEQNEFMLVVLLCWQFWPNRQYVTDSILLTRVTVA